MFKIVHELIDIDYSAMFTLIYSLTAQLGVMIFVFVGLNVILTLMLAISIFVIV